MKRYYLIKQEIDDLINSYHKKSLLIDSYQHLSSVTTICIELAIKRDLDRELCAIIGYCHDIGKYRYNSNFDHANRSSNLVLPLLKQTNLFSSEEIMLITNAIKNHSNKGEVQDSYSEVIKDADILSYYYLDPDKILSDQKQQRLDQLLKI